MSGLTYETVAKFAQQGGALYFALMFIVSLIYALWPRHGQEFKRLAHLPLEDSPLEDSEDDHV